MSGVDLKGLEDGLTGTILTDDPYLWNRHPSISNGNSPRIDSNKKDDTQVISEEEVEPEGVYNRFLESLLKMGMTLIPLRPGQKEPVGSAKGWRKFPATSKESMEEMMKKHPGCNFGLRTGDGIIVMDFDAPGGFERFKVLYPNIKSFVVKTNKGHHLYLKSTDVRNKDIYLPGEVVKAGELRGVGGYIVAPGSVHPDSGRRYEILEGDIENLALVEPDFFDQFMKKRKGVEADNGRVIKQKSGISDEEMKLKVDQLSLLPCGKMVLNKKYKLITGEHKKAIVDRYKTDDRSKEDYRAARACLYVSITEEEFITLAKRNPQGLGYKQYTDKQNEDDHEYLRRTYKKALMDFNMNMALKTQKKLLATRRKYKKEKVGDEEKLLRYLKRKGGETTVREITHWKGVGRKKEEVVKVVRGLIHIGRVKNIDDKKGPMLSSKVILSDKRDTQVEEDPTVNSLPIKKVV